MVLIWMVELSLWIKPNQGVEGIVMTVIVVAVSTAEGEVQTVEAATNVASLVILLGSAHRAMVEEVTGMVVAGMTGMAAAGMIGMVAVVGMTGMVVSVVVGMIDMVAGMIGMVVVVVVMVLTVMETDMVVRVVEMLVAVVRLWVTAIAAIAVNVLVHMTGSEAATVSVHPRY